MSKELEALEKLNHTICLNNCEKTLKFGIDDDEHIDCKDVYEFVECYNIIETSLRRKDKLEAVIELLKNEQFRNEISVLEDCSWDYNNYLKIPASKLFNREVFELLKEILK